MRSLAMAMAAASLLAFTACDSSSASRDMDVVATVNGVSIYRWEVDRQYDRSIDVYESASGGIDLDDPTNSEKKYEFRKTLVNMLVDDVIATEAAKKDYPLTAAEEAAVNESYDKFVEDNIQNLMTQFEGDSDARAKAEEAWAKNLSDNHMTPDSLKQSMYDSAVREKLSEALYKDITLSDAELQELYELAVATDKGDYEEDPETYCTQYATNAAIPGEGTMFYRPAGFKRVKQIMISLPEDINTKIVENDQRQAEIILEQNTIAREKGQNDPTVAELEEQAKSLQDETNALYEEGFAAIKDKAEEVYAKVEAGEDFDKLIEEYGDDPSMTTYPLSEYGYLVGRQSTHLLSQFVTNAMTLKDVGDISEPFTTTEGYHILKLVENVEEGPVPFEDVEGLLRELNQAQPQQNVLDEYVNERREEMDVVIYDSNI